MSRQIRVLLGIGALLAALMGTALFFVMSDPGPVEPGDTPPEADVVTAPEKDAPKSAPNAGRRRTTRQGGALITGEVRRDGGDTPVANQAVLVTGDGGLQVEATTGDDGRFRLEGLPAGGPYEVVVAAEGFATVRLPGIALDRKEERDVGILLLDAAVSVEIHVRSLADVPIEGAEILAFAAPEMGAGFDWSKAMAQIGQEPVPVARVTTGADGSATFDDLAAGSWTFLAQKDGYARAGKAGRRLRAREEVAPITLYLGTGYRLVGRVLDDEGGPVSGALVLAGKDGNNWNVAAAPLRARAMTVEDGTYAIDGLPAGDTTIMAAPPGSVPAQIDRIRIPDVPAFDIILRRGGTLTGVVKMKDSGTPVAGATIRAWAYGASGGRSSEATSDEEGRYTIDDLPEGNVNQVQVTKDGLVQVVDAAQRGGTAFREGSVVERDVEMTQGAVLEGTITGPSGPVAAAQVTIMYEQQGGNFNQKNVKTDAQGKYSVKDLGEGRVLVKATAEGLHTPDFPSNWWLALQSGSAPEALSGKVETGKKTVIDIRLASGTSISGRIELADGTPVAGARVVAQISGNFGWGARGNSTVSATDGSYTLSGLPAPGAVTLQASKPGFGALPREPVQITVDGPATEAIVVMQAWPVVTGHVTVSGDKLPTDTVVKIVAAPDRGNVRFFSPGMPGQNAEAHPVLPDGSFQASVPMVKGSFTVRAEAPGQPVGTSKRITLAEGKTAYETDVELGSGYELRGRVTDDRTGAGIAGARVRVSASGGRGNGMQQEVMMLDGMVTSFGGRGGGSSAVVAITDAEGNFMVGGLPKGDQSIKAQAEGYVAGATDARTPGTGTVTVALEPELSISGRVFYSDGKPVVGVNVTARASENGASNSPIGRGRGGGAGNSMTDGEGRFEFQKLKRGQYLLSVQNGWGGTANIRPLTSPPTPAGSVDVRLVVQPGLKITGTVSTSGGDPVGNAWINANPQDRKSGGTNVNARTKPDGTFELLGLAPDSGAYTLQVNANRFGGGSLTPLTMKDVQPGTSGLAIVLESGLSIDGTIKTAAGDPIQNAWVSAQRIAQEGEPGGGGMGNSPVEPTGKFNIGGLKPGRYRLTMNTWGNGTNKQMVLEGGQDVAAGSSGITLTATEGAKISGTVVGPDGPVNRASVRGRPDGGGRSARAVTNESGEFEMTGLEDGKTYTLSVSASGKIGSEQKGVATGASGVRLSVRDGVSASGTVTDASGAVMKNAWLFLSPVDRQGLTSVRARTDANGAFTASGMEEGATYRATVRIRNENSWNTVQAGTLKGGETGVSLQAAE